MTNDDMQRKMDFIVNQQAQFSADIQQLKELHVEAEQRMTRAEQRVTRIEDIVLRLANIVETAANSTETGFTKLTAAQTLLETRMAEIAESQSHTDQRLNALIDIVREDRNGRNRN